MADIVNRLRRHAARSVGHWEDYANATDSIVREAADEIERLRLALNDVVNPLGNLRRYAEERGTTLNGSAYSVANNLGFVQNVAKEALGDSAPSPETREGGTP